MYVGHVGSRSVVLHVMIIANFNRIVTVTEMRYEPQIRYLRTPEIRTLLPHTHSSHTHTHTRHPKTLFATDDSEFPLTGRSQLPILITSFIRVHELPSPRSLTAVNTTILGPTIKKTKIKKL